MKTILPKSEIYVYEVQNKIEAFVGIDSGYIAVIFVSNGMQSIGIGKLLLEKCKQFYDNLSLSVYKKNFRAAEFYAKEGFTIEKEQVDENTDEIEYLLPLIDKADIKRAVKIGACNLYHASCHNFLYENSPENLSALYKSSFFILQAKYFDETKQYINSKTDLVKQLNGVDKEIMNICLDRKKLTAMDEADLVLYYDKIICWSSALLQSY